MDQVFEAAYQNLSDASRTAWDKLTDYVRTHYQMDQLWNGKDEFKFRRGGKTLLTLYFKERAFEALVILGKKERKAFDLQRQQYGDIVNSYYDNSKTYHDGKWMFILMQDDAAMQDICALLALKRKPRLQGERDA